VAVVEIGAIHIVESLPKGDIKTGELLYPQVDSIVRESRPGLKVHFWREPTPQALLDRLRHIASDTRMTGRAPILHLETHGNIDHGLRTTVERYVSWDDLKRPLADINEACGLNLLVVVAACDGGGLTAVLQAHERAPVGGLVGPFGEVKVGDMENAMRAFYRTLLTTTDGPAAVAAMNAEVRRTTSRFTLVDAETFFALVMRDYFERLCTDEEISRRAVDVIEVEKLRAEEEGRVVPPEVPATFPSFHAARVRDRRQIFDSARRVFFMENLYPGHATRFKVSLAHCLPRP
jgi:hypothetical protein